MKIAATSLLFCSLLLSALSASAGMTSGTIGVSLTIVEAGRLSSDVTSEPSQLRDIKALSILTEAKDGAVVDVYINRQLITSVRSQKGVVNFELNWTSEDKMNLELRSGGKVLEPLQTAYITPSTTMIPKMSSQAYQRQVQVTNDDGTLSTKTIEVKTVVVEY